MSTKIIFISMVMTSHVEVLYMLFVLELHLNAAKRSFLRYIMHEVRVPLNSITMGIGLLEESHHLSGEDRESLLMMKGATSFMQETLNDILCMQKIEEGKLELIYAPFRPADAVQVVRSVLQGSLAQKRIQLYTLVYDDVPEYVIGDRFRIEHVLANLLSNAIKFSHSNGRIFVVVSLVGGSHSSSDLGDMEDSVEMIRPPTQIITKAYSRSMNFCELEFSVRDEGPGISREDQKKLFQDFVQIKPGEMQMGGGSGVGLSLCKQIVELHDGTIKCTSEIGVGATFSFVIPFKIHTDRQFQESSLVEGRNVRNEDEFKSPRVSPRQPEYTRLSGVEGISIKEEVMELGQLTVCADDNLQMSVMSSAKVSLNNKGQDGRQGDASVQKVEESAATGTNECSGPVANHHYCWRALLVDGT